MTEKEVYKHIKNMSKCSCFLEIGEIYKTALNALNFRVEKEAVIDKQAGFMICPQCRGKIPPSFCFCRFCGQKVKGVYKND